MHGYAKAVAECDEQLVRLLETALPSGVLRSKGGSPTLCSFPLNYTAISTFGDALRLRGLLQFHFPAVALPGVCQDLPHSSYHQAYKLRDALRPSVYALLIMWYCAELRNGWQVSE